MYYIKKYSNGMAIHNDDNGKSRLLTTPQLEAIKKEFPQLENEMLITVYTDNVESIRDKP